jgi:SAM-dependent methyltransferase
MEVCRTLDIGLPEARVLDVGCGTGFYLHQWRALGARNLAGLDFSSVAVARLRDEFPDVTFFETDIGESSLPFSTERFDIIGAFDVLFHVVDDERYETALHNIATLLRPDGHTPYSDSFLRGRSKSYRDYWKARSLHDIERLLDKAGFDILDRVPVFVLLNSPVDASSPLHQFLWELAIKFVRRSEAIGFLLGAALYPIELALRKVVSESPSTEIMVCRKR